LNRSLPYWWRVLYHWAISFNIISTILLFSLMPHFIFSAIDVFYVASTKARQLIMIGFVNFGTRSLARFL